jgi:2-polyprenyl-3-methyl-5-hydroxy-6-metoxy-1,4-benzoquinol methylase
MNDRLSEEVARALDADPALGPYLAELLADLQELGSSVDDVCDLVTPLGLPPSTRAVDLGCGKGNVTVALAKRFGFRAHGVDGFAPFIAEAQRNAEHAGVTHLCTFRQGDLREALNAHPPYDLAVLAAIGRLLGNVRETQRQLRRAVRPGGYIIVDDGYLAPGRTVNHENYEGYLPHADTISAMQSFGDTVLKEVSFPHEDMVEENTENTRRIRARAEALAKKHPKDAAAILAFVERQEEE